ncbi:uncharacterized protein [Littorina saxatilis]|uniref:RING-type domain-containing protein n=1 Tax=Littorina saxatilis TaxID=31220 RepID=A0AAN9G762_9CAEN
MADEVEWKGSARQGKSSRATVCTLPVSCQICLGMVKQPVLCSNFHVYCSSCIDMWLEKSRQCPVCRVSIDHNNPVQHIRGGHSQAEEMKSTPELRKMRFDLIYKDYEDSIEQLQREVTFLKTENSLLESRLSSNPKTGPSSGSQDCDRLGVLTAKLQDLQTLYDKVKQDIKNLKQENKTVKEENVNLKHVKARLREEVSSRSPVKYGRITVTTLESQLEEQRKEVQRLTSALERSDSYIEELEQKLQNQQATFKHDEVLERQMSSQAQSQPHWQQKTSLTSMAEANGFHSDPFTSLQRRMLNSVPQKADCVVDENHSVKVKRQLFTAGSLKSAENVIQSRGADLLQALADQDNYLSSNDDASVEVVSKSGAVPESIMKRTEVFSKFDSGDKDRTPTKKVQFSADAKKGSDVSSFDLEVPSPLTSTPLGKQSSRSALSPERSSTRTENYVDFLSDGTVRAADHLNSKQSAKPESRKENGAHDQFSSRIPPSAIDRDGFLLPTHLPQKGNGRGDKKKQAAETNDSSYLSEPGCSTPRSLTDSEEKVSHAKHDSAGYAKGGSRQPGAAQNKATNKGKSSSFDLDGPGLDETQSIQTELNDLDISMTPELSDCLKLLNRAERKIHSSPSATSTTQAGTFHSNTVFSGQFGTAEAPNFSQTVHVGRAGNGMGMGTVHGNGGWTYGAGTNGTMSGWEHGFFSSLRVNPYKHASSVSHVSVPNPADGFDRTYASMERGPASAGIDPILLASRHAGQPTRPAVPSASIPSAAVYSQKPHLSSMPSHLPSSSLNHMSAGPPFSVASGRSLIPDGGYSTNPGGIPPHLSTATNYGNNVNSTGGIPPHLSTVTNYGNNVNSIGGIPPHLSTATNYGNNVNSAGSIPPHFATNYGNSVGSIPPHFATNYGNSASSIPSPYSGGAQVRMGFNSDVNREGAPSQRSYVSGETRSSQNYSYVSNASLGGDTLDSRNSDFFLPEPKKRLFDSDNESELGSPVKTTKIS